jgi:tetratricopeptide (TPR) repeat protein
VSGTKIADWKPLKEIFMLYRGEDGKIYTSESDAIKWGSDTPKSSSGPSDAEARANDAQNRRDAEYAALQAKRDAEWTVTLRQISAEQDRFTKQIESLNDEGKVLYDNNEYDRAIAVLDNAINIARKERLARLSADSFALRARCYIEKGNFDKALEDINIALYSISPKQDERWRYLASTPGSWGAEGEDEWHKFIEPFNPDFVTGLYIFRGLIYEKKGDRNNAIADLKKAADWDWCQNAYRMENGYKESVIDLTGALRMLKERGVEYTPQMPYFVLQWEKWKPKESSLSKVSTADVTATVRSSPAPSSSNAPSSSTSGRFCGQCGNKLNENTKFCGACGTKVGG